jgi:hypothetical protein
MQLTDKRTSISLQRSRYCWVVTMETGFSAWFVPRCYKQDSLKQRRNLRTPSRGGSTNPNVALRDVGGDEKGTRCLEVYVVHPVPMGYKYGDLDLQVGESRAWNSKYGRESRGTQTREWLYWWGPAAIVNHRPILSSERVLHKDYSRKCSVEKNTGCGSQGPWSQDKLIGSKLPVVK